MYNVGIRYNHLVDYKENIANFYIEINKWMIFPKYLLDL